MINRYSQVQSVSKDQLLQAIKHGINWPLGSVKPETAAKDVVNAIHGAIKIEKPIAGASSQSKAKKAASHVAKYLAQQLMDELGNVFPDGDPHDAMENVIQRYMREDSRASPQMLARMYGSPDISLWDIRDNFDSGMKWMSSKVWIQNVLYPLIHAAFKKEQGVGVYEYLADMWDSYKGDMTYDARQSGQDVEKYLDQRGFGGPNPYR